MRGNYVEENKVHQFLENLKYIHIRISICNYLTLTMLYNIGVKKFTFHWLIQFCQKLQISLPDHIGNPLKDWTTTLRRINRANRNGCKLIFLQVSFNMSMYHKPGYPIIYLNEFPCTNFFILHFATILIRVIAS